MMSALLSALLLGGTLQMVSPTIPSQHFDILSAYEAPTKKGAPGAIVFQFMRKDPDVNINEDPAPRLKFAGGSPLVAPVAKSMGAPPDPSLAHYLDLSKPVRIPVTFAPGAAKGLATVKTTVSYFYCSKRENWCRKGIAEFDLEVVLP